MNTRSKNKRLQHSSRVAPAALTPLPTPPCYFSRLSQEVQDKIWQLTFPRDRIIGVQFPRDPRSLAHRFLSIEHPVALQVCRGSRKEAQKHYALFSTLGSMNMIYLDSENDMIHFREDGFTDSSHSQVMAFINHLSIANQQRVRNLSIRLHLLSPTTTYPPMIMFFPNLKHVRVNFRISKYNYRNAAFTSSGLEDCNCDNMEYQPARHSIFLSGDQILHHWKHHRYSYGIEAIPSRVLKEEEVPEFMLGVQQNRWGVFFQWLKPKWEFGAVLYDHMSMKNFYCEPDFVAVHTKEGIKAQWETHKSMYNDTMIGGWAL